MTKTLCWGPLPQPRTISHLRLGSADYRETLALQRELHALRSAGSIGDVVLSVEHNPVFTLGRTASQEHLLVEDRVRREAGIDLIAVERGGDITYHGPGQLVLYPILDLRGWDKDIHGYIHNLEEIMLQTLESYGIEAQRRHGAPGTWVGQRKIGSIGVHVKRWVSLHGLAFNVDINRSHVAMIRPCGLSVELVSLADLLNESPTVDRVLDHLLPVAQDVLGCSFVETSVEELIGNG